MGKTTAYYQAAELVFSPVLPDNSELKKDFDIFRRAWIWLKEQTFFGGAVFTV